MATLGIVPPKEWMKRTSLGIGHSRSALLKMADKAYEDYYNLRSEPNRMKLNQALRNYLISKNRFWENSARDKKSGGLMKYVYESTSTAAPKEKNVLERRVPEARHGVLYLWYQAEVNAQLAKIALEGSLSIANSTASMLQASSYSDGEKLQGLGIIKEDSGLDKAIGHANRVQTGANMVGIMPKSQGTGVENKPPPEQPKPIINIASLPQDPTALQKAKHFFGTKFEWLLQKIREAVMGIFDSLQKKYQSVKHVGVVDTFGAGTIGGAIASLVNFIIGKVAAHAAPFVANGIEIAQGIGASILAAKDRIVAHQFKTDFVIQPGHPTQMANAIESEMNWAIAKGLYNVAKGGVKLGVNIASWGASALVDVIAACAEFAYRILSRIFEGKSMNNWILTVRTAYGKMQNDPESNKMRPSVVFDDEEFRELFEQGCTASACVPMMTLNSGIAGDQMMFMRIFDDTGGILGQGDGISSDGNKPSASAQAQFDAATEYWSHLKSWGRNYLESTGFTFSSTDKTANGLLWHAIEHHKTPSSNVDKALHMLAGA